MYMLQGMQMRLMTALKRESVWDIYLPNEDAGVSYDNLNGELTCIMDYSLTDFSIWEQISCNGVSIWWHSLYVYSGSWRGYRYVTNYQIGIRYVMLMSFVLGLIYRYNIITSMLRYFVCWYVWVPCVPIYYGTSYIGRKGGQLITVCQLIAYNR